MILSDAYIWIKIPRTGTVSYKTFFNRYNDNSEEIQMTGNAHVHMHYDYENAINNYNRILPGVTVVRHPMSRFYSSLQHMLKKKKSCSDGMCRFVADTPGRICNVHNFSTEFLTSTEQCIEFLSENFIKNCYLKQFPTREKLSRPGIHKIFKTKDPMFIQSFFTTQVEFAYHPKVRVFKYEKIHEFNTWIQQNLGYDTTQIPHVNSANDITLNIDITNPNFVKVVEMMFYDDYKLFNYPLKYLT